MSSMSTVLRSNSSNQGKAAIPSRAGCMPASSYKALYVNIFSNSGKKVMRETNHDGLALVLYDMTGPSDLHATS